MSNLNVGKLLVAVCVRCVKNRLSHNFKPQHLVSITFFTLDVLPRKFTEVFGLFTCIFPENLRKIKQEILDV